jgi:TRAP-type C4-dicarboxylate transport system permease small subunit
VSHGFDAATAPSEVHASAEPRVPGTLGVLDRAAKAINRLIMGLGGLALFSACLVLSYSVVVRYVFHEPTEWQDEMAVFLIVGATFGSAAAVQSKRGHVAIEALTGLLPPSVNRVRLVLVDVVSLLFCLFFTWKSWHLDHEAWTDGQVSQSTWGPPLWIPYTLMAVDMSLLCLQIALQIAEAIRLGPSGAGWARPKVGIGADINRDMKGLPDATPAGPDPMGTTVRTGATAGQARIETGMKR